jgi:hypothetical protein
MLGEMITLPFRIWLRGTQLALRVGEELTGRAAEAAFDLAGAVVGARSGGTSAAERPEQTEREPPSPPPAPRPVRPRPAARAPARLRRPAPASGPPPGRPTHLAPAPDTTPAADVAGPEPSEPPPPPELVDQKAHVSEEPELVLESAEPGAEEGAGASVTVLAPWEGYGGMDARQVIDRMAGATTEELAAVQLYEGTHRNRRTILEAVQRQLRSAAGGTSRE